MPPPRELSIRHPDIQRIYDRVAKGDPSKIDVLDRAVSYLNVVIQYPGLEEADKLPVPEVFEHPLFQSTRELNEYPGRALRRTLQKIRIQEQKAQTELPAPKMTLGAQQILVSFIHAAATRSILFQPAVVEKPVDTAPYSSESVDLAPLADIFQPPSKKRQQKSAKDTTQHGPREPFVVPKGFVTVAMLSAETGLLPVSVRKRYAGIEEDVRGPGGHGLLLYKREMIDAFHKTKKSKTLRKTRERKGLPFVNLEKGENGILLDSSGGKWASKRQLTKRRIIGRANLLRVAEELPYITANPLKVPFYNIEAVQRKIDASSYTENQRWFQTVFNADFGDAIRYIRVNKYLSREEFSKLTRVSVPALERTETGEGNLSLRSTNKIIKANGLDNDVKSGQLLRLKSQNIKVMSIQDIEEASFGQIVTYLRVAKGISQIDAAVDLPYSASQIAKTEKTNSRPNNIDVAYADWLDLNPAMRVVLHQKAINEPMTITSDMRDAITNSDFLFTAEPLKRADAYLDPVKDIVIDPIANMAATIATQETVGNAFLSLVGHNGITEKRLQVALGKKYKTDEITQLRTGQLLPYDYLIGGVMSDLDYDIHHPVTQAMLRWGNRKHAA